MQSIRVRWRIVLLDWLGSICKELLIFLTSFISHLCPYHEPVVHEFDASVSMQSFLSPSLPETTLRSTWPLPVEEKERGGPVAESFDSFSLVPFTNPIARYPRRSFSNIRKSIGVFRQSHIRTSMLAGIKAIETAPDGAPWLLLATGRYIGRKPVSRVSDTAGCGIGGNMTGWPPPAQRQYLPP